MAGGLLSCNGEGRSGKESVMQSRFWTGGLETAQSKSGVNLDCNSDRGMNKRTRNNTRTKQRTQQQKKIHRGRKVGVTFRLAVVGAVRETLVLDTEK